MADVEVPQVTFVLTINGRSTSRFPSSSQGGATQQLLATLGRMDGDRLFALLLGPGDVSVPGDNDRVLNSGAEYLQCAGSADAMTLEHRATVDGAVRHVVVGTTGLPESDEMVELCWQSHSALVWPNEVFDSMSASAVFEHYYFNDGDLPGSLTQRELDQ